MKHFSIHIAGKVQGVYFRATAKEKAESLRITGSARNNGDGSVSIEAEGEEQALMLYIDWCKKGPPHARVDRCEIAENELRFFSDFSINREFEIDH